MNRADLASTPAGTGTSPSTASSRRRESRARIGAVALELVLERGLDDVTVDEIARAANVSRRTFFNYFPSKVAACIPHTPPPEPEAVTVFLDDRSVPTMTALSHLMWNQVSTARRDTPDFDRFHDMWRRSRASAPRSTRSWRAPSASRLTYRPAEGWSPDPPGRQRWRRRRDRDPARGRAVAYGRVRCAAGAPDRGVVRRRHRRGDSPLRRFLTRPAGLAECAYESLAHLPVRAPTPSGAGMRSPRGAPRGAYRRRDRAGVRSRSRRQRCSATAGLPSRVPTTRPCRSDSSVPSTSLQGPRIGPSARRRPRGVRIGPRHPYSGPVVGGQPIRSSEAVSNTWSRGRVPRPP